MEASLAIVWANEAALGLAVAGLASGVVYLRAKLRSFNRLVAPAGALTTSGGPPRGAQLGGLTAMALDGSARHLSDSAGPTLLMFVSDACPISRKLIPIVHDVAKAESLRLLFAGDDDAARQQRFAGRAGIAADAFLNDMDLGRTLGVDKLPYAFLIGADGRLVSRGLVNSREHIESLIVSGELGIASLQSYLSAQPSLSAA